MMVDTVFSNICRKNNAMVPLLSGLSPNQTKWVLLVATLSIVGWFPPVYADKQLKVDDLFSLSLSELLQVHVTVSTLTEESLRSVPASVTVFTQAHIRQLGVNTLEALMNHVPGYQSFRSDHTTPTFSSRSRHLAHATREVLLLLDGQRLNHDLSGGWNESGLPLENVERVEFLRGPGSAIYGANAFLGVVNIITATNLNEVTLSTGSDQQQKASLSISGQLENGLHNSLFIETYKSDGEQQARYDPLTATVIDSRQSARIQSIYWRAQWGDWDLQVRHAEDNDDDGHVLGSIGDGYNHHETNSDFFALNYQHTLNDNWRFSSRLYDSPYRFEPQYKARHVPLVIAQIAAEGSDSGFENQLRWHEGSSKALLGLDVIRNSVHKADANTWLPPAAPQVPLDFVDTETRRVTAGYAQWQDAFFHYQGRDQLTYILGVRHDDYSDIGSNISPRLGLIWNIDSDNTLKWLYGEAFRAPTRSELSVKNIPTRVGNPNLEPEISKTFELVWMQTREGHYRSISLFDTNIKGAVELTNTAPPNTIINGASQHISGLELEWQWYFAPGWQLRTDLSYLFSSPLSLNADAEDLLGSSLLYSQNKISASISGRYHGESRDPNTSAVGHRQLGGYTVFDAHLHYQITRQWQVYGNLRNLTDKSYGQPALLNANNIQGVAGLGREIEVGIRWNFDK